MSVKSINKIHLHQFPRCVNIPNISGFGLKLETYLRMAGLAYENVFGFETSLKGKSPWIEYNSKQIADSQFAIEFLNKEENINLNSKLTEKERGVARALRIMTEESLFRTGMHFRMFQDANYKNFRTSFPFMTEEICDGLQAKTKKSLISYGIWQHGTDEINRIAREDIKAISVFIGENKYVFGENATEIDATIFGHLAQLRWSNKEMPAFSYMRDECPNLWKYCDNMKEVYWPDWDKEIKQSNKSKL